LIELFRARLNSKSNWQQFVVQGRKEELQKLRNELGEIGGAGHFFGHDNLGTRDSMEEEDLKMVLRLLAAGEKKINLKEREF
jgi:nitroimidazol reductase NimA-like FMN-containing flavoprotein (pyridoxamine 5'-phosphate oxidase superfamily)